MPYKVTMLSAVDELTEEARMVGAINNIFLRRAEDGKTRYIGTNTDTSGIREAFLRNYSQLLAQSSERPALVIGGGGACRAAVYALSKWMGVSKIYMVNRVEMSTGLNAKLMFVSTIAEAAVLEAPALIVGTVPDITPKEKGEVLASDIVDVFLAKEEKGFVLEMCYHPNPRAYFFNRCEKMGWNVLFGTESMICLWTELPMHQFNLDEAKQALTNAIEMHVVH
ncbi:NAD(P)-binding protein [Penicillium waksmanii]|uniref:NAD(P)-binding protein n=1 Tax=Penicillium waksmanii TaxID=69791 RepID=UPI0025484D62|nr:NAD(P)-binding protein [Penicillium waksmanii]KAJ5974546.1 NAD(P)-binding protein [Penicillium waksmanii]